MHRTRPPESELIARAQAGDAGALEELLACHRPRLERNCARLCRDATLAEDVVQDTLLAVCRSLAGYRGEAPFDAWLYLVARSVYLKHRRRRAGEPEHWAPLEQEEAQEQEEPGPSLDTVVHGWELGAYLGVALGGLAEHEGRAVLLCDVEGFSLEEAASLAGTNLRAFKSRLHRGRAQLRALFRADGRGGFTPSVDEGRPRAPWSEATAALQASARLSPGLRAALASHARWKSNLRQALALGRAPLPSFVVERDDQCELGQWLRGTDVPADLRANGALAHVQLLHQQFHACAAIVVAQVEAGLDQEARAHFERRACQDAASLALVQAMREWSEAPHAAANPP